MGKKPNEDPIKLIQILPLEDGEEPSGHSPDFKQTSLRFKVQIGDEGFPLWASAFAFLGRAIRALVQFLFSVARATNRGFQKGGQFLQTILRVLGHGLVFSGRKTYQWGSQLSGEIIKLLKKMVSSIPMMFAKTGLPNIRKPKQNPMELVPKEFPDRVDEIEKEIRSLRDRFISQQNELIRVTTQLGEVKAQVLSQQQLILHLGKELEAAEIKARQLDKVPAKKSKSRTAAPTKPKRTVSEKPPPNPSLGIEAPS
jgi:hypothetical protein